MTPVNMADVLPKINVLSLIAPLVTRDVPPYALFAGNPGRVQKMRFADADIEFLPRLAWWEWPYREDPPLRAAHLLPRHRGAAAADRGAWRPSAAGRGLVPYSALSTKILSAPDSAPQTSPLRPASSRTPA